MLRETARITALVGMLSGLPAMACDALAQAGAETIATRVVVRVIGRDSKIIGSGVGGAQVSIVDAWTGETLATGKQEGGTGDTDLIISTPHARGTKIYDTEGAAGFTAELQLAEPTIVNISAIGPLGYPQAIRSATKQVLLVPGGHVEGDGVILELHGFIVEILDPEPLTPVASAFDVTARVRMMCGCVIEPGGLWDANEKEFVARLKENGRVVSTARLEYAGEANIFEGTVSVPEGTRPADLELEVVASDAGKQNFGRHAIPLSRGG